MQKSFWAKEWHLDEGNVYLQKDGRVKNIVTVPDAEKVYKSVAYIVIEFDWSHLLPPAPLFKQYISQHWRVASAAEKGTQQGAFSKLQKQRFKLYRNALRFALKIHRRTTKPHHFVWIFHESSHSLALFATQKRHPIGW